MKFELSEYEFLALYDYFMKRAGWISYEFDQPIWRLIERMHIHNNQLVKTNENQNDRRTV